MRSPQRRELTPRCGRPAFARVPRGYVSRMDDPLYPADEPVRDAPAPFSMWLIMLSVPVIVIGAWLLLPDTGLGVALLVVIAISVVFLAVWRVMSLRRLSEPPGRHPVPPPSTR